MKGLTGTFSLFVIFVGMATGAVLPLIHVDNTSDEMLEIIPLDAAHRSSVPASLASASDKIPHGAYLLLNHTNTPVTAVISRWTYTDRGGALQQRNLNCDAYIFAPLEPIVRANDLSLITPSGCGTRDLFPRLATEAFLGSPLDPNDSNVVLAEPNSVIHLYVDSVIFQDGRIWGRDKIQYHTRIERRYAAIVRFVAEVTEATNAGEQMPSLLARIRNDAESSKDEESRHRGYYAGLLLASPNAEGTLAQLRRQVPPPTFHHIQGDHQ